MRRILVYTQISDSSDFAVTPKIHLEGIGRCNGHMCNSMDGCQTCMALAKSGSGALSEPLRELNGVFFQLVEVPVAAVPNHAISGAEVQQPLVIFGPVTLLWPVRRYFGLIQVLPALDVAL